MKYKNVKLPPQKEIAEKNRKAKQRKKRFVLRNGRAGKKTEQYKNTVSCLVISLG